MATVKTTTNKSSVDMSIPKERKVRGYVIRRMPIGQYLRAMQIIQEIPEELVKALFPDAEAGDALKALANIGRDGLRAMLMQAMGVLPSYVIRVFAELSGITEEQLLGDTNIGLDGLVEMLDAWIEVNGVENFTKAAGALVEKVRKRAGSVGFSA